MGTRAHRRVVSLQRHLLLLVSFALTPLYTLIFAILRVIYLTYPSLIQKRSDWPPLRESNIFAFPQLRTGRLINLGIDTFVYLITPLHIYSLLSVLTRFTLELSVFTMVYKSDTLCAWMRQGRRRVVAGGHHANSRAESWAATASLPGRLPFYIQWVPEADRRCVQ